MLCSQNSEEADMTQTGTVVRDEDGRSRNHKNFEGWGENFKIL
jgi:hypothetical protein